MYINLGDCELPTLDAAFSLRSSRKISRSTASRSSGAVAVPGGYNRASEWSQKVRDMRPVVRRAPGTRPYSAGMMRTTAPTLYGMRNLPALGDYEYGDENLGKFKLKNVVKSVTKAATQVAKVAVKPAALVAGSSLQAVGLRSAANKMGKAVGLTEAERKLTKYGGTAIQAAAITAGAIAAAPYAGAALTAAGKGVMIGGKFVATKALAAKGLVSKALPLVKNLLGGNKSATGEQIVEAANAPDTSAADAVQNAIQTYGSLPGASAPAAETSAPPPVYSAGVSPSGDSAGAPNPLTEASMFGGLPVTPKLLLIGGAVSVGFYLMTRKRGRR